MRSTFNAPEWWNRHSVLMLALAVALVTVPVGASAGQEETQPPAEETQAPAEEAQAAQEAGPPAMGFTADTGMIFYYVAPGETAAFEEVITKVKEALAKSEDPIRQQQAESWRVFKADEPMGDNVLYVFFVDPAVAGADYDFIKMLAEGFQDDPVLVTELYAKLKSAFAGGGQPINLRLAVDMGGM
jgi:hypothetical protein